MSIRLRSEAKEAEDLAGESLVAAETAMQAESGESKTSRSDYRISASNIKAIQIFAA